MIETPLMKAESRMNIEDVFWAVMNMLKDPAEAILATTGLIPQQLVLNMTWRPGPSPELPEVDTFQGRLLYEGDLVPESSGEEDVVVIEEPAEVMEETSDWKVSQRPVLAYWAPLAGFGLGLVGSIAAMVSGGGQS